jgi:hypothetical protein
MTGPVAASVPSTVTVPSSAAAVPAVPSTTAAMPTMASTAAATAMTVMTSAAALARTEFVGCVQQAIRLHLERGSARIRILCGLRGRHRGTERQRRSECECNHPHFLVLLFADIPSAQAL